jgi:hypothetical protein
VFFHEGESGNGGIAFINQATPLAGQNGAVGATVALIGRGGSCTFGGSLVNGAIAPIDPAGWDGAIGCGGSGAIATPAIPAGTPILGGKSGSGLVLVTEFIQHQS